MSNERQWFYDIGIPCLDRTWSEDDWGMGQMPISEAKRLALVAKQEGIGLVVAKTVQANDWEMGKVRTITAFEGQLFILPESGKSAQLRKVADKIKTIEESEVVKSMGQMFRRLTKEHDQHLIEQEERSDSSC
jgi:hypothetical protein